MSRCRDAETTVSRHSRRHVIRTGLGAAAASAVLGAAPPAWTLRLLPNVLGQRLPAEPFTATTSMALSARTAEARAGLGMLGATYCWAGLRHDGDRIALVCRTADEDAAEVDATPPVPPGKGRAAVRLRVTVGPGAVCRFAVDTDGRGFAPLGAPFTATAGTWIGATVGLCATGPAAAGAVRRSSTGSGWARRSDHHGPDDHHRPGDHHRRGTSGSGRGCPIPANFGHFPLTRARPGRSRRTSRLAHFFLKNSRPIPGSEREINQLAVRGSRDG
ncbi:hypothetical protein LCH29_02440 [Streptomyces sp. BRA346]